MAKILLTGFFLFLSSGAMARSPNLKEQLATMDCTSKVSEQLSPSLRRQSWYSKAISIPGKPLMYGVAFRDTRFAKAYQIWSEGPDSIFIESDLKKKTTTKYVWNSRKACEVKKTTAKFEPRPPPVTAGFTDEKLSQLMKEHKWGVIYVWTPYMPLSVDALKEIKIAVKAKGGHLTILLDGKASLKEAQYWVDQKKVLSSELTPVGSAELYELEMGLHYPIAFLYQDKFLSNRTYIGHKTADVYKKWIDLERRELKQDLK